MTTPRVLRALSRFDEATTYEVSVALGLDHSNRNVWGIMQQLVADGLAERLGGRGRVARYRLTDAGRAAAKNAA